MTSTEVLSPPLGTLLGTADELYLSFKECPFDDLPADYEDGDDRLVKGDFKKALALALEDPLEKPVLRVGEGRVGEGLVAAAVNRPRRIVVPHPRDLKLNDVGDDVFALQRALAAAPKPKPSKEHYRKWGTFTHAFGKGVVAELKEFQADHGIPATGQYGEATHRALAPYYDAYGLWLLNRYSARTALAQRQQRALAGLQIAYNFRDVLHYTQGSSRWFLIANHVRQEQLASLRSGWGDCSAFATWTYWDVGAPDPNELNFSGGYTGTLRQHGTRIDIAKAKVGAMFHYGPGTGRHVGVSVGGDASVGFGSEAGPLYVPGTYRPDLAFVMKYAGLS